VCVSLVGVRALSVLSVEPRVARGSLLRGRRFRSRPAQTSAASWSWATCRSTVGVRGRCTCHPRSAASREDRSTRGFSQAKSTTSPCRTQRTGAPGELPFPQSAKTHKYFVNIYTNLICNFIAKELLLFLKCLDFLLFQKIAVCG
jgi:hypothetical protein